MQSIKRISSHIHSGLKAERHIRGRQVIVNGFRHTVADTPSFLHQA